MTRADEIRQAQLDWGSGDTAGPRSIFFDDIYFSGDGPAETRHVFLDGVGAAQLFETREHTVIGELGFGSGLNFLMAWDAWTRARRPAGARFHFFSVEAFPLSTDDLARAHANWPALAAFADILRKKWPPRIAGRHIVRLSEDVTLTLLFGDALDGVTRTDASIDAWFFDGFSPAKNPAMWSPALFAEVARLSASGARFATFTVAGDVRRALSANGFRVEKRPGFGKKREMLAGVFEGAPDGASSKNESRAPWFDTRNVKKVAPGASVAIIGAGIAGASLARALMRAGLRPVVYEAAAPASGASGNPAGLIMPRLDLGDTPAARFHRAAYLFTISLLTELSETSTGPFFNPCGVLHHATNDRERAKASALMEAGVLPEGWMREDESGLFFPQAGVAAPAAFVSALLGDTPLINKQVTSLENEGDDVCVVCDDGARTFYDSVVIANGPGAHELASAAPLPLAASAGQVDHFPDARAPAFAHAMGPYAAPAMKDGAPDGLIIGATYEAVPLDHIPVASNTATESNINIIVEKAPALVEELRPEDARPRASLRATTPDRMPVAGPMPDWAFAAQAYRGLAQGARQDYLPAQYQDGVFTLTGLGSRGLVTAPFAATTIAAEMTGAPSPIDHETREALHPLRFLIRDIKRGRPLNLTP
ncbi:MAG: bifunctional tRNA (5-methylaminomethyl-2-thiouridine)(34)-methyltransferase MnmD/FAD-dependent 5-carboxymethylaminomethyl-2-thiouridine(34) oxidoreductase MnmC [Pseudomonadota bacterium]